MVGRPRQFDRDEALDKAITLFWEQGFEATGIAQISTTLGIGRQSLYGTFGDKRSLFLEALRHYSNENIGWLRSILGAEGRAVENIHAVLDAWAARASDCSYCGCFLTNSMSELGLRDPEMTELLARNLGRMTAAFETALERAVAEGDIDSTADTHALAKTLVNTAQGLSSAGKVDHDYAHDVVAQMKRLLR
jgi:TetR/AcrR family transcriptional repressor of nem operon